MTLEALKQAEQRTVGVKQTQKAVARQAAEVVYIASDADERVTGRLLELCQQTTCLPLLRKACWKSAEPAAST